jgi:hypothetical protein
MEPLTTTFATILGLVSVFKDETREREGRDFDQYLDWLRRQEHKCVVDLILGNQEIAASVRVLIEDQHGEVMGKLAELDKVLATVAARIAGFQPLAKAVQVETGLSDQAVSILHQMNEAGTSKFLEITLRGGNQFVMLDKSGEIHVNEPRFMDDDLGTLCNLGLLRLSHNSSGGRIFTITRAGAAVGG